MMSLEQYHIVRLVLCRFKRILVDELPEVGGLKVQPYDVFKHFKEGWRPITKKPYRLNTKTAKLMLDRLENQVEAGILREETDHTNPWKIPCFPVFAPGRPEPRVVLACMAINDMTNMDYGAVPLTKESVEYITCLLYTSPSPRD